MGHMKNQILKSNHHKDFTVYCIISK